MPLTLFNLPLINKWQSHQCYIEWY